jgi:hypothetical protein
MNSFTPGPYVMDFSDVNGPCAWKIMAGEKLIGYVSADLVSSAYAPEEHATIPENAEAVATAHLLAAAPKMLAALKAMEALVSDILESNNVGNLCFQDYANLNEAPMLTKIALKDAEPDQ